MDNEDDLLEELHEVEIFKDLNRRHLKRLAPLVEIRDVKEGEELIREGAFSGEFFVILQGDAAVSVRGKHRATLGPGEFCGELSLLHHSHSATITALQGMTVLAIDSAEFRKLLDSEHSVALHMLEILILRFEELTRRPAGQLE